MQLAPAYSGMSGSSAEFFTLKGEFSRENGTEIPKVMEGLEVFRLQGVKFPGFSIGWFLGSKKCFFQTVDGSEIQSPVARWWF